MEHVLRNTIYALLDQKTASLPDILHMLTDKTFRAQALRNIQNEQVNRFLASKVPQILESVPSRRRCPYSEQSGLLPL